MRQTIFKDGIIETLPSLIGDGESAFSVQNSMLENFERICKALLGNASSGRVMAGLSADKDGTTLRVNSGYGITKSGKLVVVASQIQKTNVTSGKVYLKYISVDRGNDNGGHSSWINREQSQESIIKDGVGAWVGDANTSDMIIISASGIAQEEDTLYIGDITEDGVFVLAVNDNESIEYVIAQQVNIPILCTNAFTSSLASDSLLILPLGRKMLKQINMYVPPMTNSFRSDVNYTLSFYGKPLGGGLNLLGTALLSDGDGYQYKSIDINKLISTNDFGVYFTAATNGTDIMTAHTAPTRVEYIIEKLN
jgi:hypothetical protein